MALAMANCNTFKIQKAEKKKEYCILPSPDGNLVLCFHNLINDTRVTGEEELMSDITIVSDVLTEWTTQESNL